VNLKEKKRAFGSLALGILLAFATESALHLLEWHTQSGLSALIAECKKPLPPRQDFDTSKWHLVCEPEQMRADSRGIQGAIVAKATALDQWRTRELYIGPILLALFILPLIWYFFLDRVRELSAAISGR
jgi:hypothetical protein